MGGTHPTGMHSCLELLSEEPVERTVICDYWRHTEVRGQLQQMLTDKSNDEALGQWIDVTLNTCYRDSLLCVQMENRENKSV